MMSLLTLGAGGSGAAAEPPVDPATVANILLVQGQSNTRSEGTSGDTYPSWTPNASIKIWNPDTVAWETYAPGTNSDPPTAETDWGPEARYSELWAAANPTLVLWIVKFAINGTYLSDDHPGGADDWLHSANGELYEQFADDIAAALAHATFTGAGYTSQSYTEINVQGEADGNLEITADEYEANKLALLVAARTGVGADGSKKWANASMTSIIVRICDLLDRVVETPYADEVRYAQYLVWQSNTSLNKFVDIDDLTPAPHFNETGVYTLGERCYGAKVGSYTVTDATPGSFTFTDQSGAAISTLSTSNEIQITGFALPTAITIAGGDAQYRIRDRDTTRTLVDWTSSAGIISPNQRLTVRRTSSPDLDTELETTITIGGVASVWSLTTASTGDTIGTAVMFAGYPYVTPTILTLDTARNHNLPAGSIRA